LLLLFDVLNNVVPVGEDDFVVVVVRLLMCRDIKERERERKERASHARVLLCARAFVCARVFLYREFDTKRVV
jgi:hypothetical protein